MIDRNLETVGNTDTYSYDKKSYSKLYYEKNKDILYEKHKEYMKQYKIDNAEKIKEKDKIRYQQRKEYTKLWKDRVNYNQKLREKRRLLNPPIVLTEDELIKRDILRKKIKCKIYGKVKNLVKK